MKFRKSAFTLMELLVVISIIALLSSVVLSSLSSARSKARDAKRIADLNTLRTGIETYFIDKGFYPQSSCGWDCNGYLCSSAWGTLATDLKPYIETLPIDPVNSGGYPWADSGLTYCYGNVGKSSLPASYDLTAHLETPDHPQSCKFKNYTFYFGNNKWCTQFGGSYSNQIYEYSP